MDFVQICYDDRFKVIGVENEHRHKKVKMQLETSCRVWQMDKMTVIYRHTTV